MFGASRSLGLGATGAHYVGGRKEVYFKILTPPQWWTANQLDWELSGGGQLRQTAQDIRQSCWSVTVESRWDGHVMSYVD